MENYIINENTIAILKNKNKTIIIDVDNIRVINKNIKFIIECNCLINGSNLNGRKEFIKKLLNIHYKIPIIINYNIILLQINSIKNNNSLFIILNKIKDYKEINNNLNILCVNNYVFSNNISKNSFEKLIINGIKINNIIKYEKNVNFV